MPAINSMQHLGISLCRALWGGAKSGHTMCSKHIETTKLLGGRTLRVIKEPVYVILTFRESGGKICAVNCPGSHICHGHYRGLITHPAWILICFILYELKQNKKEYWKLGRSWTSPLESQWDKKRLQLTKPPFSIYKENVPYGQMFVDFWPSYLHNEKYVDPLLNEGFRCHQWRLLLILHHTKSL